MGFLGKLWNGIKALPGLIFPFVGKAAACAAEPVAALDVARAFSWSCSLRGWLT